MAEQERDRLMDHSYDGIQEYDNPMPRWWVTIFWLTIIFAILYALNVPGVGVGAGRIADYNADVSRAAALREKLEPAGGPTPERLATLAADPRVVSTGKQMFAQNCTPCHRPDAGGLIGPNLTDDYWLHGGTLAEIRKTINDGVLAKGMPQWGKVFKPDQINALAAYVSTLRGSNPPNPKPPEGIRVAP